MRPQLTAAIAGALLGPALIAAPLHADAPRPNIVHIFADDMGWGSVGFNGQTKIATPNLDALAAGGMRLTNSYSAPVCAPSRAMLYTGFHQGHTVIDGNDALSNDISFRASDVMTGSVMKDAGYSTGIFGKWGFGATEGTDSSAPTINLPNSLPTRHGYDEFYGYLNHGTAHDYFEKWMWKSNPSAFLGVSTEINDDGPGGAREYTHDLIAARSEAFIADHADDASPFFMEVNYTIPHFDIETIANAPGGYGIYANMPWTNKEKAYAAMITRMDDSIGSLMATLRDPDGNGDESDSILNDTLVMFSSDNGGDKGTAADPSAKPLIDFFNGNGPYRGGKFETFEGGIHSPAIAYWPGVIAPNSTSDHRTDLADLMATAADLAGVETPVGIDGSSIAPVLTGEGPLRQRDYMIFEHQGARGTDPDPRIGRLAIIRQDGMKLIRYSDDSQELYNLTADPYESNPLPLGNSTNAQIAAELRAAAVAEGALRGVVEHRAYTGPNGGNVEDDSSWDGVGRPHSYWSATISNANLDAHPRIAHVTGDVTTLGFEVRGETALQAVDVHAGRTLTGRNEVRIGALGRVDLSGGTLASSRWVNIRSGGELRGQGMVKGDVYNEGRLSPGRADESSSWPIAVPAALPPITLDTGVVTATTFNFSGVQDDVPLQATSTLSPYVEVAQGLDFGPGVMPKLGNGGTDAGNEFNLMGHTSTSLTDAVHDGDYVSFKVDPVAGVGAIPSSVTFRVWRNGSTAAKNFAILSSLNDFLPSAPLAQAAYNDSGSGAQHTLTASLAAAEAVTKPIEFRLYAWNATNGAGNTHVNAASLSARFVAVPTLEFDFTGVQDGAPLAALKRTDASLALSAGLACGPGVAPRGANDAGNEFHVAGFSTGGTLQNALDGADYLSFAVQPVQGMALYPDSVSFTLWRQGSGSASDYAVFSSVGGFGSGQQLSQAQHTTTGAGNRLTLTGAFAGAQPTTDSVEFRLYGWNAATNDDSTHVTGASMRARFASVVGSPIDPTGNLTVQGDFIHLDGGMLAIDLGGAVAGASYDVVNVLGEASLTGDLVVALADEFAPSFGDSFQILTATDGVTGEFANVSLPQLAAGLDWQVDYSNNAVSLNVMAGADFNRDGSVDAADLSRWRLGAGQTTGATKANGDANNDGAVDGSDFLMWQRQFGSTASSAEAANTVPEPTGLTMQLALCPLVTWAARRRAHLRLRRRVD